MPGCRFITFAVAMTVISTGARADTGSFGWSGIGANASQEGCVPYRVFSDCDDEIGTSLTAISGAYLALNTLFAILDPNAGIGVAGIAAGTLTAVFGVAMLATDAGSFEVGAAQMTVGATNVLFGSINLLRAHNRKESSIKLVPTLTPDPTGSESWSPGISASVAF